MVHGRGHGVIEGLLHGIQILAVPVIKGKIKPGMRAAVAVLNGGPIFLFGACVVFVFFGDSSSDPVGAGGINCRQGLCLACSLVLTSADNARSFQIKLSEVVASVGIAGS